MTAETLAAVRALVAELGALEATATKGPWRAGDGEPFYEPSAIVCPVEDGVRTRERILFKANWHFPCEDDIAYVLALRNALPRLRALVGEGEP